MNNPVILSLLWPILIHGVLFNDTTRLSIRTPQVSSSSNSPVSVDFELFSDKLLQSYSFCSNLTVASSQHDKQYHMVRCMLPLYQSLRLRKVVNLHDTSLTFNQYGYHQGQIWSLVSVLNHFERVDSGEIGHSFCMFGDYIPPHILITLLSFPAINQLLLFNHGNPQAASFLSMHPELELLLIAAGKTLRELSFSDAHSQHHQCDAILLLPSYLEPNNAITLQHLSMLIKDRLSPILWLSADSSPSPTDHGQQLLSWRLTSTWNTISEFIEAEDRNGFLAKSYNYDSSGDYSVSTVLLGCLSSPPSVSPETIIIITYTIRVFADTAFGLQTKLMQQLGYKHVFVLLELTFESLLFLESNFPSHNLLQIAIAPHDITTLLHNRYVVYHMEQVWSVITSGPSQLHYNHILRHALAVWTFGSRQQSYLLGRGITEIQTVYLVPVDTISRQTENQQIEYANDLIFFGSCSSRRMEMITDLITRLHEKYRLNIFCGGWKECVFDEERDIVVTHAKLALNLQAHEHSVLEVHRITYLLSMGKCILSERGSDALLAKQFEHAVIFVDSIDQVQEKVTWLLSNEQARLACEAKAVQEFVLMSSDTEELKYAMDKAEERLLLLV